MCLVHSTTTPRRGSIPPPILPIPYLGRVSESATPCCCGSWSLCGNEPNGAEIDLGPIAYLLQRQGLTGSVGMPNILLYATRTGCGHFEAANQHSRLATETSYIPRAVFHRAEIRLEMVRTKSVRPPRVLGRRTGRYVTSLVPPRKAPLPPVGVSPEETAVFGRPDFRLALRAVNADTE